MINKFLSLIFNKRIYLLGIFLLFSIFSCIVLFSSHIVGGAFDLQFNWQRIYELRNSFEHFNFFPQIALNQFNQDGSAVMVMYPYMNLVPAALLSFFIPFIPLVYILFILRTFLSLIISYYSCYHFGRNKKTSFLFATSYSLSTLVTTYVFHNMDIGVSDVMLFLPLVLFGFWELLNNNKWLEVSIGVTLILYSHILGFIMVILMLIVLVLLNYRKFWNNHEFNSKKLMSLLAAILLTLLTTSVFWIQFLNIWSRNDINPPMNFSLTATTSIDDVFKNGITGSIGYSISIIAILGIISGIIAYKYLDKYSKQIFWVSIIVIIMCSGMFPWKMLSNTPVNIIQFPWRLYIFPQLFLCYIFSVSLIIILKKYNLQNWGLVVALAVVLIFQLVSQVNILNIYKNDTELSHPYASNTAVNLPVKNGDIAYKISDSNNFKYIINSEELDKDYYPVKSLVWYSHIVNHQAPFDVVRYLSTDLLGNGKYTFNNDTHKAISELNLPFFIYNGINYKVLMDGKAIPFTSNNAQLLTINNVKEGKHSLRIFTQFNFINFLGLLLSLIGLIINLYLLFMNYRKKKNVD